MTTRDAVLVVWVVIGLAVVAAAVVARRSGGRLPDYGALARAATRRPVLRAGLVLAWMWLGWHAFAR